MALGDLTDTIAGESCVIELLASATAVNGIPTSTAGIDLNAVKRSLGKIPNSVRVAVRTTAGSDTMTVTLRVWGRAGALWFRLKDLNTSSAAPHTAVAIPENSTDSIKYSEVVEGVSVCDRLYLEIVAIAGTSTAVTGYGAFGK
jgi:hypothetical protein